MKFIIGILAFLFLAAPASAAGIRIVIDKSSQTVTVHKDGVHLYQWATSTGARDRWTPNGTFGVQSLSPNHYSSKYNNAPMPHSIFFNGNVALHGTDKVRKLGSRDSKGCARLSRAHAKILFDLVKSDRRGTVIVVQN